MPKFTVPTPEQAELIRQNRIDPKEVVIQFEDETKLVLLELKPRKLIRDIILPIHEVKESGNQRKCPCPADEGSLQGWRIHGDLRSEGDDNHLLPPLGGGD